MNVVLPRDSELVFPDFRLVSASAGSGKTTALTQRFLQLLMSPHVPHNSLRNILAMTFTNNAAAEMKERILEDLKRASLGEQEVLGRLREILSMEDDDIAHRAGELVDVILDQYSDFQVQT